MQDALKLEPENPELHFSIGVAYDEAGAWEEGLKHMRKVLEINLDNANA